jgi:F-type H+-transporting ATPase subunit c
MAATRVFASRLATQMATKAARPAIRANVAAAGKRTITGKHEPNRERTRHFLPPYIDNKPKC